MNAAFAELSRTSPFGTQTFFRSEFGRVLTGLGLKLLGAVRPERDARSLNSLHFAYWVVVSRRRLRKILSAANPRIDKSALRPQMLFLSEFSGDWEDYLLGFNRVLIQALDFVWGFSVDWQRNAKLSDYLEFVRRYQIVTRYHFQAYGRSASVHEVRDALHLSEVLERFALEVEGLEPSNFDAAYERLLVELGSSLAA